MQKLSELTIDTDDPTILMALIKAHRPLAELKGVVKSIPNQQILLSTLTLQEAKDSSEIENIITTQFFITRTPKYNFWNTIFVYPERQPLVISMLWPTMASSKNINLEGKIIT